MRRVIMLCAILLVASGFGLPAEMFGEERSSPPRWLSNAHEVATSALRVRAGTFQGITSVGAGEDVSLGFASFYLRSEKSLPAPPEIKRIIQGLLRKGGQSPEKATLDGDRAAVLLVCDADPAMQLIVTISPKRPQVGIGLAHLVDDDVYQIDSKSDIAAWGDSEWLWDYCNAVAKEAGTLVPAERERR